MEINILEYIAFGCMIIMTGLSWISLHIERKRAIDRERTLFAALLDKANNPTDYGAYLNSMKKSPDDIMKEMELENDVILAAAKEQAEENKGVPVT